MKETGIIMSGSHPIDILEGRKTLTRRLWGLKEINKHPDDWELVAVFQDGLARFGKCDGSEELTIKCPYGGYGDRLRVKETFMFKKGADIRETYIGTEFEGCLGDPPHYLYKADDTDEVRAYGKCYKWRSSMFMPRKASRILLEITEIRAERLRAITLADALAEGGYTVEEYIALFLRLNKLPEDANPWVWPISFRLILSGGVGVGGD